MTRPIRTRAQAALLFVGWSVGAQAQVVANDDPMASMETVGPRVIDPDAASADVTLHSIGELSDGPTLSEELHGAREALKADWPASFYSALGMPARPCTHSLVAARALLTAAHCVADGGSVSFSYAGRDYKGTCKRHPAYAAVPRRPSADYALCLVTPPVEGVRFERVGRDPLPLAVGRSLLLTGFGCTDHAVGGSDGIYRIGDATIQSIPAGPKDNYIVAKGEAVLCFGDSGGPAYLVEGGVRRIVSVNSQVENAPAPERSFLSSTMTPDATAFFAKWKADQAAATPPVVIHICGLDEAAVQCR